MIDVNTPPPVLDGGRLLAYAIVDGSIVHTSKSTLYVDGKLLGRVPKLAICQSQDTTETLLLFCDEGWNSLGAVACASMDEARKRAESEYRGIESKWIDA